VNFLRAGAQQAGDRQQLPVPRRKTVELAAASGENKANAQRSYDPRGCLERPLPHNLDAERSILGAILLDNHALNAAVEKLQSERLLSRPAPARLPADDRAGRVQQAIDLVTLTEELQRRGELEASGGAAYLAQLVDGVPRITNVDHYARIVKEKAICATSSTRRMPFSSRLWKRKRTRMPFWIARVHHLPIG